MLDRYRELLERVNACPYYRHLGFEVETAEEGFARIALPVQAELLQFQGALHGGAIYSIADAAAAVALLTLADQGQHVLTVEGKVNFLLPVREGELVAEGRIVHRSRWLALGEADVRLRGGERPVAKGLFTYAVRSPR